MTNHNEQSITISKRRVVKLAGAIGGVFAILLGCGAFTVSRAHAQVAQMQGQAAAQQATIQAIDQETLTLRARLEALQRQDREIRRLIGVPMKGRPSTSQSGPTSWLPATTLPGARRQVAVLVSASAKAERESDAMTHLALRILNIHRIRDLARAQMIAAIPSIDPVAGAEVIGCFCYRTAPDTGFHKGVDLGASYGETVRAAASGTVVSAGFEDGGFGIKIDIDHGNGYHTWYAHLSSVAVSPGQRVYKGQSIAAVGSTGFSTGPHLHYQVMYNGVAIDPAPFLNGVPANVLASL